MSSSTVRGLAVAALGLACAYAPAAQVDQDVPGARRAIQVAPPALEVNDRDPGSRPVALESSLTLERFVSDQDADAIVLEAVAPSVAVARAVEALDNGRGYAAPPLTLARSEARQSQPQTLNNGRGLNTSRTSSARRAAAVESEAPLNNGRSINIHERRLEVAPATVAPASVEEAVLSLSPVMPNPVGDRASVSISVAETSPATLTIYDVQGRAVASLFDGVADAGSLLTVSLEAPGLSPGTYVVVLVASGYTASRTFQVVR